MILHKGDILLQEVFQIQGTGIFSIPYVLRTPKRPNLAISIDVCLCYQPIQIYEVDRSK